MHRPLLAFVAATLVVSPIVVAQTDVTGSRPPALVVRTADLGDGAGVHINARGDVLIVTGNEQIDPATRTFIWTSSGGRVELAFDETNDVARGWALNDSGQVVGEALSPRGLQEAFIWSSSTGMRVVSYDPVFENSRAVAVNDAGELVGVGPSNRLSFRSSAVSGVWRGFPPGTQSDGCLSNAVAISRWGESVGAASPLQQPQCAAPQAAGGMRAYLLRRDSSAVGLGTLGGAASQALAINDRGQVVGWSFDAAGATRAFMWSAEDGMIDIGTLGGAWSRATAINNRGQVAGVSVTRSGDTHTFVWSRDTGFVDAGPGSPAAINDLGQLAGTSSDGTLSTAFVWSAASGRRTVAFDARALDINARGQVVGGQPVAAGPEHAIVWQLEVSAAETIASLEARTAVLAYGGERTNKQLGTYTDWIKQARHALAGGDRTSADLLIGRLSDALAPRAISESAAGAASTRTASTAALTGALAAATTGGAVFNLKVVTDASPDLTDLPSLIHSATSRWTTDREKVWALFYWSHILKRQTPPIVLHGLEVTDPIRNFTDFGNTMCSTISGINQSLFGALGLKHQYWDVCNHTVSSVEYDGAFHMVDSSMSNLVTKDDGTTLASVTEAAANSARLVRERSLYSTSPNGFLTGTDTMRKLSDTVSPIDGTIAPGFANDFCADGLKYRDYYYNWDGGHRYVLNVRENESYTRYYRQLDTTPDYWIPSEKVTDSNPALAYEIDSANRFGIRGNGRWSFSPPLTADSWSRGIYRSANIAAASSGGLMPAAAGQTAEVVYKVSAADAIASQTIRAQFAHSDALATASIAISVNQGATWKTVGSAGSATGTVPVTVNLRADVSGTYETLIQIRMTATGAAPAGVILTSLTIDTITQVNTKALPKLNIGRNTIAIGAGDQSDTMVLWPDLRGSFWTRDVYDSRNIASQTVSVPTKYTAVVYPAVLNQDAYLTYRMDAPSPVTRLVYGGRLHNYQPGSYIDFLHSFDGGTTWIQSYRLSDTSKPYDVLHFETITNIPAGVRTVLFKYLMHNTNTTTFRATGLFSIRMEADYRPANIATAPVDVTFRWKEVTPSRSLVERSHRQRVATWPFTYVIDTGGMDHPVMESLRVSIADPLDTTLYGYSDGTDVGGQTYTYRKRTDRANLAMQKRYTVSRAPSGFQNSAGSSNTTILTDGVVGAPMTGGISYWWGQCWNAGADLDLQVDLGQTRTVTAFRAHLFGYPFWDALKGQVQDQVEIQTSTDGVSFVSRGYLQTSLWKKDVPINYMLLDDETATAWNFELTTSAVSARYVRYHIIPKRILCASELQVFDRVDYTPFDIAVALPGSTNTPSGDTEPPTVTVTAPTSGASISAVVTLSATASDNVSVARVDFFADGTNVGSDTTAPYAASWDSSAVANGTHTITAGAADAAGNTSVAAAVVVTVANATPPPPTSADDIVLYASGATRIAGAWRVENDPSGAGGKRLRHPEAGAAKLTAPLANPVDYFELTFDARANTPYHLWLRGRADADYWGNDSVFVQFSNVAAYPIGTTTAAAVTLEDCLNCGVAGWGWQDNGYASRGADITFLTTGRQTIRIQTREDGFAIDQIILSPTRFLTASPGALKNDTTIYPATTTIPPPPPATAGEVVLYASGATRIAGAWRVENDPSGAGGKRLRHPEAGAAKLTAPLANPVDYFELTFDARANTPYHLWLRGRADADYWGNDSVFVQFSNVAAYPIGTTTAAAVTLEDCLNCGVAGWGWQDNGYAGRGAHITFSTTGRQTIRIQTREDGFAIDQIVFSPTRFLTASPGALKKDTTILPQSSSTPSSITFKVANWNVRSGRGVQALTNPQIDSGTLDCSLNASKPGGPFWKALDALKNDSGVIALGVEEAWFCATPTIVASYLSWPFHTNELNGTALLARYGTRGNTFQTFQFGHAGVDASEDQWMVSADVCADAACTVSVPVHLAHMTAAAADPVENERLFAQQAQNAVNYISTQPSASQNVVFGDFNYRMAGLVSKPCGSLLTESAPAQVLSSAGYTDAWLSLRPGTDGDTGMWNRSGCGMPNGGLFKRIDYVYGKGFVPVDVSLFGVIQPGVEDAPSDHAGILVTYSVPAR